MRHSSRINPDEVEHHDSSDLFTVAAVICAAIMVAIIALHGGPDLLGGQFDLGAALASQ